MKALSFLITEKADADLEEIWLYTFEIWSQEQADRYYDLIFEEIGYICKKPNSGRSIDDLKEGYRVSKVKSHLIFYKVANNVVEVIRILHERMDIESRLND